MSERIHTFAIDYRKRDGRRRWQPVNVGFFAHGVPRLTLLCRLLGHRPVVEGTTPTRYAGTVHRWVCCDRCGLRGSPQGNLDPDVYADGDRYLGPWGDAWPDEDDPGYHKFFTALKRDSSRGYTLPGPIPRTDRGALGGQLVIGRHFGGFGFEWKVGSAGSEHVLAASLSLGWLGVLYLHTEAGIGQWLQRRLNPTGCDSKVTGVTFGLDEVRWRVWSNRDSSSRAEPWWRNGGVHLRPVDRLLGRRLYAYEDIPGQIKVGRLVQLPEDEYLVELTLQRQTLGRARGPKKHAWAVDWSALGKGLPTEGPEQGRVFGSGVTVTDRAVQAGTWPAEAAARIALRITEDRAHNGWDPISVHKIAEEVSP